jgi:hypothetical protein
MPEDVIKIRVDAKTFQDQLGHLAATMVEKVFREGRTHIAGPAYAGEDIAAIIRYAASIYNLLNYLNADERRKEDCYWYPRYGVTGMTLVRSLIDCLYNIFAILDDPVVKAASYRKSGIKQILTELDETAEKFRGQAEWEAWINQRRAAIALYMSINGFSAKDIMSENMWPTLGRYVRRPKTERQKFLKSFTLVEWRQYSALSHGACEAFLGNLGQYPIGAYYMNDFLPHAEREKLEETFDLFVSTHLGRAASILLCIVTELQAYCRFDGANIDKRICDVWEALLPMPVTKELYEGRYSQLMRDRGISPSQE